MSQEVESWDADLNTAPEPYVLRLYITGVSVNSVRALTNIKHICETHLAGRYSLDIIDVYQQKDSAEQAQIIALPLLIKVLPLPVRRLIGDLSNTELVLNALGLS
ncbi:circadian clock KaiB family protein [Fibrella sp. HMF5335]|uniref:Circadian clock KaiB family protein n=1 Tax=Fibrella rubiginis TaxID=2817060 RepID=A0A939GKN8_9BACT|nr:circadian clock KaiB family protein [Fibrella rubiginis]MBO0938496.1 circadian clock KaiB family protein [Fibrella rubiginis]